LPRLSRRSHARLLARVVAVRLRARMRSIYDALQRPYERSRARFTPPAEERTEGAKSARCRADVYGIAAREEKAPNAFATMPPLPRRKIAGEEQAMSCSVMARLPRLAGPLADMQRCASAQVARQTTPARQVPRPAVRASALRTNDRRMQPDSAEMPRCRGGKARRAGGGAACSPFVATPRAERPISGVAQHNSLMSTPAHGDMLRDATRSARGRGVVGGSGSACARAGGTGEARYPPAR